jgi:Raf kinase inhibitor-like YbhB/YbcL family protein
MRTISGPELKSKHDRHERVRLVEALPPEQFEEWHLPGAVNIPADRVGELAAQQLPDRDEEIVVYCSGPDCQASGRTGRLLERLGYRSVSHYPGGKEDWQSSGYPIERGARAEPRRPVQVNRHDPILTDSPAIDALSGPMTARLRVGSKSFRADRRLPDRFSDYGEGRSPELHWSGLPAQTQSTVVLVEDTDAGAAPFAHWLVYNLSPTIRSIPEAVAGDSRVSEVLGAIEGNTSAGRVGYFGPRPPRSDPPHHYHFEVFALDSMIDLEPVAGRNEVLEAMNGHVLASGEVVATYGARLGPI